MEAKVFGKSLKVIELYCFVVADTLTLVVRNLHLLFFGKCSERVQDLRLNICRCIGLDWIRRASIIDCSWFSNWSILCVFFAWLWTCGSSGAPRSSTGLYLICYFTLGPLRTGIGASNLGRDDSWIYWRPCNSWLAGRGPTSRWHVSIWLARLGWRVIDCLTSNTTVSGKSVSLCDQSIPYQTYFSSSS